MVIKENTNAKIEKFKRVLGLKGDVYFFDNKIANLELHKKIIPTSKATTIEEAEIERIAYEKDLKEQMLKQRQERMEK